MFFIHLTKSITDLISRFFRTLRILSTPQTSNFGFTSLIFFLSPVSIHPLSFFLSHVGWSERFVFFFLSNRVLAFPFVYFSKLEQLFTFLHDVLCLESIDRPFIVLRREVMNGSSFLFFLPHRTLTLLFASDRVVCFLHHASYTPLPYLSFVVLTSPFFSVIFYYFFFHALLFHGSSLSNSLLHLKPLLGAFDHVATDSFNTWLRFTFPIFSVFLIYRSFLVSVHIILTTQYS